MAVRQPMGSGEMVLRQQIWDILTGISMTAGAQADGLDGVGSEEVAGTAKQLSSRVKELVEAAAALERIEERYA
jgi:hypothetical protein